MCGDNKHAIAELQEPRVARRRLFGQHVERCGGERARVERVAQRVEIHDGTARSVDEHRRRLQQREPRRSMSPRVSAVRLQCSVTTSASRSSVSRSARSTP